LDAEGSLTCRLASWLAIGRSGGGK
jgi:hypothetical protein